MNTERIRQRGHGRNIARSTLELVADELKDHESVLAFLDELTTTLQPEAKEKAKKQAERKLSELSETVLRFGAHAGKRLDDIDRGYLHWLAGATEETLTTINAYLKATKHFDEIEIE